MVKTLSTMLDLGTIAPDFSLPDAHGNAVRLSDFKGAPALLVIFMCNHCPFVKHIIDDLIELAKQYQGEGVAIVGINSNDVGAYPEDHPDQMARIVEAKGITFPYLYDESQQVAKDYRASCTPDFFLFDREFRLVYRGQMDDSRPGNDVPITGGDLRIALDLVLAGQEPCPEQQPSMGCNIKWKPGNEPQYF